MNCDQYQEFISQFLDGELEHVHEEEMFRHLSSCEVCRAFLKNNLVVRNTLSASRYPAFPPSLDRRILQQPSTQHSPGFRRSTRYSIRAMTLAAMCSLIIGVCLTSFWYKSHQPQQTIVCLTPLPEVEVTGYEVIGHIPSKGHQQ